MFSVWDKDGLGKTCLIGRIRSGLEGIKEYIKTISISFGSPVMSPNQRIHKLLNRNPAIL